ncbi:hypothetical protein B9Z55_006686 [Caenorhabditis nigoni]|uniref:Uncharacterized protein n=1 Tax=Caenorhabditis nigoni TaxID=1611254 RepID=A0A2G5V685_9PELO|nr:hypothetical protein B9Z55_006686 [Caenorhabditis nigoni]
MIEPDKHYKMILFGILIQLIGSTYLMDYNFVHRQDTVFQITSVCSTCQVLPYQSRFKNIDSKKTRSVSDQEEEISG